MARVKRGVIAGRRHKKVLKKAKGYYNARRKVYRTAKQAVIKAGQYAYRDRRANSACSRAERRVSIAAATSSLSALIRAPAALRSAASRVESALSCAVMAPFLPRSSTLSCSSSARLEAAEIRLRTEFSAVAEIGL